MNQPGVVGAVGVDLRVAALDLLHLRLADLCIVQRRGPVRPALEDGEMLRLLRDLGDRLDRGCPGADDADALAGEIHRRVRPARRVIGGAAETLHARNARQRVRRQDADRGEQEARACRLPAFQGNGPLVRRVVPVRGGHARAELHVPAQIELVGDQVQVFEVVRLGREMLLPVPFLQQLLREGIAVAPAFGIEARAGVAAPVPGAAEIGAGFEDPHLHAELPQPVELIDAGDPGADDNGVVRRLGRRLLPVRDRRCIIHD